MASAPSRALRRVLCALLALVAVGAAGAPAQAATGQTAAVQTHLLWTRYDAADRERQLDRAREAGAGMVRVDLGWASLEQEGKGHWNSWYLNRIDHVVNEAQERGIKVLFTFWETPCWASTAPETLKQGCSGAWWDRGVQRYPPANARDYGDALAFLVRRYGNRVAAWELWNEPNHPHYFKAADPVASYAQMVKAAYPAAKAADPRATIIAGSLADADFEFTSALLDHGVGGNFDAWSVHPYSEDRSPMHPGIPGWTKKSFAVGVPKVRDTLVRRGERKPIWLTEFGWSTCTVRGQTAAYDNCVDERTQADWLERAFSYMRNWDYVPMAAAFNLEDTSTDSGERVDNYGLMHHNGTPKLAFAAFRSGARLLNSNQPVPPVVTPPAAPGPRPQAPGTATSRLATPIPQARSKAAPLRRVTLRAARRGGRVRIVGNLSWGRTLQVRAYRWKPRERRWSRVTSYRALIKVGANGDFRHRLATKALRRGRWLIVVKGRRTPLLQARKAIGR